MKKIILSIFVLLLSINIAFTQPVSDMGVIPIGVTLNSILRLEIVKGGNIEFVVNTIDQFTNGIINSAAYITNFKVASSVNFNVGMYAEGIELIGQDDPANKMLVENIGYKLIAHTGAGGTNAVHWDLTTTLTPLTSTNTPIVLNHSAVPGSSGNGLKNNFDIQWELGTPALVTATAAVTSLLTQSLASDRYVTNVFLILSKD